MRCVCTCMVCMLGAKHVLRSVVMLAVMVGSYDRGGFKCVEYTPVNCSWACQATSRAPVHAPLWLVLLLCAGQSPVG